MILNLTLNEDNRKLMSAYLEAGFDGDLSDAQNRFVGQYESDIDFAQELLESCEELEELPDYIITDWQTTARNIMFDHRSENGYYFLLIG